MLVVGSMIDQGIIVSSDMVRQLGSAGWLIAMWCSPGNYGCCCELRGVEFDVSKAGGQYVYIRSLRKTCWFSLRRSFFAVIQTGTIAAVGVASAKFTAYLFPALVIQISYMK
jgi:APA family basic amino acid/polyamine antiporter